MIKLGQKEYQEIRTWLHRNARPLELALWRYHFEGGCNEDVLHELTFYQNEDGGFGHALEPDNWNPDSSPYTTLNAINILLDTGLMDNNCPVVQGIFRFLESGAHRVQGGWRFNVPTNDNHAHAPWWTWDEAANATESTGVTAELCAFLLLHAERESALWRTAADLASGVLEKLKSAQKHGDMGIGGYVTLLDAVRKAGLGGRFGAEGLAQRLRELVDGSIVRDPEQWAHYGVRPSLHIKSPESAYYHGNEQIVARELDYLIETRPEGSVWGIEWSWFEHNERYAGEFAVSQNWWMAIKAIEKVRFLRSYGRVDTGAPDPQ